MPSSLLKTTAELATEKSRSKKTMPFKVVLILMLILLSPDVSLKYHPLPAFAIARRSDFENGLKVV
jgi:hypothetical protein